jgi:predicted CXXCH cytochrome family protein
MKEVIFKRLLIAIILPGIIVAIIISNNVDAQDNNFPMDIAASCITSSCHADMAKKKYSHEVGVNKKYCNKCHEIEKEGEHSFKKLPLEVRILCIECHSKDIASSVEFEKSPPKVIVKDGGYFHAPFAEGNCTDCHNAHESNFIKQLKAEYPGEFYASYSTGAYSLCLNTKCHKGFEKALTEPRTLNYTKFRNGNLNLHFRHVNKEKGRTCRACHHHHNSKNPKLIRETFPFRKKILTIIYEKTETGGGCATTCHIPIKYDRYKPEKILMKTTPRPGKDATPEELKISRKMDIKELKEKLKKSKNN